MVSEGGKETVQDVAEVAADHISRIGGIVVNAVRDIVSEISSLIDDVAAVRNADKPLVEEPAADEPVADATDKAADEGKG